MSNVDEGADTLSDKELSLLPGADVLKKMGEEIHELWGPLGNNAEGEPLSKFGGFWLPSRLPTYWPQLRNFPFHEDDVIIASFPKSGTHWVRYIVHLIKNGGDPTLAMGAHDLPFPIEMPFPPTPSTIEKFADLPPPRSVFTHLSAPLLPRDTFKAKVIYIYRNAKDTAVSYYHHHLAMKGHMGYFGESGEPFEEFVKHFMKGEILYGPYPEHVKGFVDLQRQGKPILILKYEELKKDPDSGIAQIAEFLGKKLDAEAIEKVKNASSFNSMVNTQEKLVDEAKKIGLWDAKKNFYRKGEVGDWRNHFDDPEVLYQFEHFIVDSMPEELIAPENI